MGPTQSSVLGELQAVELAIFIAWTRLEIILDNEYVVKTLSLLLREPDTVIRGWEYQDIWQYILEKLTTYGHTKERPYF